MLVLGIESSCDDCSIALVKNGSEIIANVKHSQEEHKEYYGVVPELASRLHVHSIGSIYKQCLESAKISESEIDLISLSNEPGLSGSLIVGLSFAKGLSIGLKKPLIGINHIMAHLYAPRMESSFNYPYLALLLSGGHSILAKQNSFDNIEVLGRTLDDACGEVFDKVAKFYDMGFPGGPNIEKLALKGERRAFNLPKTTLERRENRYDMSFSGLKTASTYQLKQFHNKDFKVTKENIAASFQYAAIENLITPIKRAVKDTGIKKLVVAGGVASNLYLRERLSALNLEIYYPSLSLCTDNGAMIAGLAYHYYKKYGASSLDLEINSRVEYYKKRRNL